MPADGTVLAAGGLNETSSAVLGTGTAKAYDPTGNT
jgi:hypothetical protein